MIFAIVGSRSFTDYEKFKQVVNPYRKQITQIVSGGAAGADGLAFNYACENSIPIIEILPDWNKFGKSAGPIRNKEIVVISDFILAFWDGISRGTKNTLEICKKLNKKHKVIRI